MPNANYSFPVKNEQNPKALEQKITNLLTAYQKTQRTSFVIAVWFSVLALTFASLLYFIIISNSLNIIKSKEIYPLVYSELTDAAFKNKLTKINLNNVVAYQKLMSSIKEFFQSEVVKNKDGKKLFSEILQALDSSAGIYSFRLLNADGSYQTPQSLASILFQVGRRVAQNGVDKGDYLRIVISVSFFEHEPISNSVKLVSKTIIDDEIKISINDAFSEWGVSAMSDNTYHGVSGKYIDKYFSKKPDDLLQITTPLMNILSEKSQSADNIKSIIQADLDAMNGNFEKRIDQISSGDIAYVFDVIKRAVVLLMFSTFSFVFIRAAISELKFTNNITSNYLSYLMFEASSKGTNDLIAFRSSIAEKPLEKFTSNNDSATTESGFLNELLELLLKKVKGK